MDRIEKLKTIFQQLDQELRNPINKKIIEKLVSKEDFDYENFHRIIKSYIRNIHMLNGATDELLNTIYDNASTLLEYFKKGWINSSYLKNIIGIAIVLLDNVPSEFPENYIDNALTITRGEFAQRYDQLVRLLNPLTEESNLVLETKVEKTPFKLFRNTNNAISVKAGQEKTPLSFTLEKLMSIVYDGMEAKYHKSYSEVIIEKILDNSIFDSIQSNDNIKLNKKFNFDFMPEARIKKLEEQLEDTRLKSVGKIKELEDKINEQSESKNLLEKLIEKGENAENDFRNAQAAIEKELRLQKSYKFWEIKQKRYFWQYLGYLVASIVFSLILLFNVSNFLEKNPLVIDIQNAQKEMSVKLSDKNITNKSSLNTEIKRVNIWEYGFLIFATTLAIWLIKIFVKIALSNYHLSIDAGGRVIMIRTYLALLKEGKGFEAEDKKVMLDNIFRPTNIGIIQDETSVTIADVVSSFKK